MSRRLLKSTCSRAVSLRRLLYKETVVDESTIKSLNETTFYAKQMRVALRNCGVINPENIDEYIAIDGYQALGKVPHRDDPPEQVIQTHAQIPVSAAVAAQASPPAVSGSFASRQQGRSEICHAVTPTRATLARSWTVPFWRATRTASSKPWPLPVMPSAQHRVTSMSVQSTPSRFTVCRSPSTRRENMVCWAKISSTPALISTLRSASAPAHSSAAKRLR